MVQGPNSSQAVNRHELRSLQMPPVGAPVEPARVPNLFQIAIIEAQEAIKAARTLAPAESYHHFAAAFESLRSGFTAFGLTAPNLFLSERPEDILERIRPEKHAAVGNGLYCLVRLQKDSGVAHRDTFGSRATSGLLAESAVALYQSGWELPEMSDGGTILPACRFQKMISLSHVLVAEKWRGLSDDVMVRIWNSGKEASLFALERAIGADRESLEWVLSGQMPMPAFAGPGTFEAACQLLSHLAKYGKVLGEEALCIQACQTLADIVLGERDLFALPALVHDTVAADPTWISRSNRAAVGSFGAALRALGSHLIRYDEEDLSTLGLALLDASEEVVPPRSSKI